MKIKNLFRRGKEQRKAPCMRMKPSIENEDRKPLHERKRTREGTLHEDETFHCVNSDDKGEYA